MVARDIALVRLTRAPVHFLHLSTAGSVDLVRRAKEEGLPVTAEAAPHHMLLTHAEVAGYDPVFKVNPPLRTDEDVAAVVAGLCDGTIDAVATDHAPARARVQGRALRSGAARACWVSRRRCLSPGRCCRRTSRPERIFALLSTQPAAIARLASTDPRPAGHSAQGGPVESGAAANLCVFDPAATTVVEPGRLPAAAGTRPMRAGCSRGQCATRCCVASRSWSTRWRSGDGGSNRWHRGAPAPSWSRRMARSSQGRRRAHQCPSRRVSSSSTRP